MQEVVRVEKCRPSCDSENWSCSIAHLWPVSDSRLRGQKQENLSLSLQFSTHQNWWRLFYFSSTELQTCLKSLLQHFPQLKTKVKKKKKNSHKTPVSLAHIKFDIFSVDPAAGRQQKVVMKTAQLLWLQLTSLLSNFIQQTARFVQAETEKHEAPASDRNAAEH